MKNHQKIKKFVTKKCENFPIKIKIKINKNHHACMS
jgi:hypothetical protein